MYTNKVLTVCSYKKRHSFSTALVYCKFAIFYFRIHAVISNISYILTRSGVLSPLVAESHGHKWTDVVRMHFLYLRETVKKNQKTKKPPKVFYYNGQY